MTRKRITPPWCMGRRMSVGIHPTYEDNELYFLALPELSRGIVVTRFVSCWEWKVRDVEHRVLVNGTAVGMQAAANAAERYLVRQAELTLKLAGRRAA